MGSNPFLDEDLAALRSRYPSEDEEVYVPPMPPAAVQPAAAARTPSLIDEVLAHARGVTSADVFGHQYEPPTPPRERPDLDAINDETERAIRAGADHIKSTQGPEAVEPYVYAQHTNLYGKRVADALKAARDLGRARIAQGTPREEAEGEAVELAGRHLRNLENAMDAGELERTAEHRSAQYEGLLHSFTTREGLEKQALGTLAPTAVGLLAAGTLGLAAIPAAALTGAAFALGDAASQKWIEGKPVDWRAATTAGVTGLMALPGLQGARAAVAGVENPLLRRAAQTGLAAAVGTVEQPARRTVEDLMTKAELPPVGELGGEAATGALANAALGGLMPHGDHPVEALRREAADGHAAEVAAATPPPARDAADLPKESIDAQLADIETALVGARGAGDLLAVDTLERQRQTILDLQQKGFSAPRPAEVPPPGEAGPPPPAGPEPPVGQAAAAPAPTESAPPGPRPDVEVRPGPTEGPIVPGEQTPGEAAQEGAAALRPGVQALSEQARAAAAGEPEKPLPGVMPGSEAPPELGLIHGPKEGIARPQEAPRMPPAPPAVPPAAPAPGLPPIEPGREAGRSPVALPSPVSARPQPEHPRVAIERQAAAEGRPLPAGLPDEYFTARAAGPSPEGRPAWAEIANAEERARGHLENARVLGETARGAATPEIAQNHRAAAGEQLGHANDQLEHVDTQFGHAIGETMRGRLEPELRRAVETLRGRPPAAEAVAQPPEPEPARRLRIGRGAHGQVEVVFPDSTHADLFSAVGRSRRQMRGESGRPADWKGLAQRLEVPEGKIGEVAQRYRAQIQGAIRELPEGSRYEAPRFAREVPAAPARSPEPAPPAPPPPAPEREGQQRDRLIERALQRIPHEGERALARKTTDEQFERRRAIFAREDDWQQFGREVNPLTGQKITNRAAKRRAAKDKLENAKAIYEAGWETLRGMAKSTPEAPAIVKRLRLLVEGGGVRSNEPRVALPITRFAHEAVRGWVEHVGELPMEHAVERVKEYAKAYPQNDEDALGSMHALAGDIASMSDSAIASVVDLPGVGRKKIAAALERGPEDPLFRRIMEYRKEAQAQQRAFEELVSEHSTEPFEHPGLLRVADNLDEDLQGGVASEDHPLMKTFMWGVEDPATGKQADTQAAIDAIRSGKGRLFARIRHAYNDAMSVMQHDVPFDIPEGGIEGEAYMEAPKAPRIGFLSAPQDPFDGRYGPPPRRASTEQLSARERWARLLKGEPSGLPAPRPAAAAGGTEREGAPEVRGSVPGGTPADVGRRPGGGGVGGGRGPGGAEGLPGKPEGAPAAERAPARGGIFYIVNPREAETLERPAKYDLIPARLRGVDEHGDPYLSEDQALGVAKAIEALNNGSGFLFEDGTGVGKTRELLAVAHTFAEKGDKVLIVSPAAAIEPRMVNGKLTPSGSYRDDSAAMKVPLTYVTDRLKPLREGAVHLGTYHNLRDYAVDKSTVVLFDEAHKLKNAGDSETAGAGADLIRRAKVAAFATATPGDKPYHLSYLASVGFLEGKPYEQAMKDLGVTIKKRSVVSKSLLKRFLAQGMKPAEAREKATETVDVWKTGAPRKMRKAVEALFRRLTRRGTVIKREVDLSALQVFTHQVALPEDAKRLMDRIEQGKFDRKNALMHMRRQQEPYKLAATQKMISDELSAGRQIVVFATRVNQSEVRERFRDPRTGEMTSHVVAESEGTLKQLASWLKEQNVPFAEIHGEAKESSETAQGRFQRGEAKVVIATYEKGGTGINLDDRSGAAPRSMVIMTAPFDSVSLVQAIGRVHRFTTRSPSRIHVLFSDHGIDAWNGAVLMGKLKMHHALVAGDIGALDLAGMGADEEKLNAGAVHYLDASRVLQQYGLPDRDTAIGSARQWGALVNSLKQMGVKGVTAKDGGNFSIQTHEGFELNGHLEKGQGYSPSGRRLHGALRWEHDSDAGDLVAAAPRERPEPKAKGAAVLSELSQLHTRPGKAPRPVVSFKQYHYMARQLQRLGAVWGSPNMPGAWQIQTQEGHFITGELVPPAGSEREGRVADHEAGGFWWEPVAGEVSLEEPDRLDPRAAMMRFAGEPEPSTDPQSEIDGPVKGFVGPPIAGPQSYVRPHLNWRKPARLGMGIPLEQGREVTRGVRVLSSAMREGFASIGKIDYDGQYVGDIENAAAVFHSARNPSLEHGAVMFIDKAGVVRGTLQAPSHAPSYVAFGGPEAFVQELNDRMAAFRRNGVEIAKIASLHNHPSGNPEPSAQDLEHAASMKRLLKERYLGSAIVNHEQATIIPPEGEHYRISRKPTDTADPDPFLQSGMDSADYHRPESGYRVRSAADMRGLIQASLEQGIWKQGSRDVNVMFLDRKNRLAMMALVPRPLFESPRDFKGLVGLLGRVAGANRVYAAGEGLLEPDSRAAAAAHQRNGVLQDALDLGSSHGLSAALMSAGAYHGRDQIPWHELQNPQDLGEAHSAQLEEPPAHEPPISALPDWKEKGDPDWWQRRVRFARERLRAREATAAVGVDPRSFWDAAVLGADMIRKGARSFVAWAKDLGASVPWIGPHARKLWNYLAGTGAPIEVRQQGRPQEFGQALKEAEEAVPRPKGAPVKPIVTFSKDELLRVAEAIARGQAGEAPEVGKGKPVGVGKAGDFPINIHQITDEAGIRTAIAMAGRVMYDRLGEARMPTTMAEIHRQALELGYTPAELLAMQRERGALTAPAVVLGRVFRQHGGADYLQKAAAYEEAKKLAAEKDISPQVADDRRIAMLDAYREREAALQKFAGLMYGTAAAGAESGRALRAHGLLVQLLTPTERMVYRLMRGQKSNERYVPDLLKAIRSNDFARAGEVMRKMQKPGLLRQLIEYYYGSLLSAPGTLVANVSGNFVHEALLRTPERAVAARIEQVGLRQALERFFRGEAKPTERVVGEAAAALKAQARFGFGLPAAIGNTLQGLMHEDVKFMRSLKGEVQVPAIPGVIGKIVRAPMRMMEGADLAARQSAMGAEQSAQLFRRAYGELHRTVTRETPGGHTTVTLAPDVHSPEFKARLQDLHDTMNKWIQLEEQRRLDPVAFSEEHGSAGYRFLYRHRDLGEVYAEMEHQGDISTFRDATTRFSSYLKAMRNTYPALTFLAPFIHTSERILVGGFRRTPLGLLKTLYNIREGTIGGGEASDRLAQGIMGTMLTAAVYMWAKNGVITGGGPDEPRERENWLKTGKLPYAVKLGNTWVSYGRIEPLATSFGFAADAADATNAKDMQDAMQKLHYAVLNNVANKTYLQGIVNAAEALGDPRRFGGRFWDRMIGAAVPNILASAAHAIDPTIRETDTVAQTLMARVPVLSERLPPRLTGTGEPAERPESAFSRFLSPFRYNEEAGPEKNLERLFIETGYNPSQPPKIITLPGTLGRKVDLTDDERRDYAGYALRATQFARALTKDGDWTALDPYAKAALLKRIYRFAHDAADRQMLLSVEQRLAKGGAQVRPIHP